MMSGQSSPVLADSSPMESRVGMHPRLISYAQSGASFSTGEYIQIPKKKAGKLEDVMANGWLDAMKSSSPPSRKLFKDLNGGVLTSDDEFSYSSWMVPITPLL